jgi:glycine betaine/proline transport system ATP-binding protein
MSLNDTPKIVVDGLCKIFGPHPKTAQDMIERGATKDEVFARTGHMVGVHKASFEVREGEIFVLMGLSGSGKSTLIRLINRLIEPTGGKVFIDGRDLGSLSRSALITLRRTAMSMVFQSFALMPQRTVLANAAFGLEVAGIGRKARERSALEVLEQVGLGAYAHKLPAELSGGMQQRVGLARALTVNPSLLLMDEAFSALDPLRRKEMQNLLLDLQQAHRRTIVFVSHDLDEALRIADRIAVMRGGRVVQVGTPQDIVSDPADDYVRAFFEAVDTSRYLTAADLMRTDAVPLVRHSDRANLAASLDGALYAFVLDGERRVQGYLSREERAGTAPRLRKIEPVARDAVLEHVVSRLCASPTALPVVDDENRYCGSVDRSTVLNIIARSRGAHV